MFLLSLFWLPPFSVSRSLSLSLSLSLVPFFLPSCLFFAFFWCLVFFLSLFFCLLRFCFMKGKISKDSIAFLKSILSLLLVSCLVFSLKSLCLIFFILIFSHAFRSTSMLLVSKTQVEKHQFLVKKGVATKGFFYNLCFVYSEKLSVLGGNCLAKFWLMFNKTL